MAHDNFFESLMWSSFKIILINLLKAFYGFKCLVSKYSTDKMDLGQS